MELEGQILRRFVPAIEKVDQEHDKTLHKLAALIAPGGPPRERESDYRRRRRENRGAAPNPARADRLGQPASEHHAQREKRDVGAHQNRERSPAETVRRPSLDE